MKLTKFRIQNYMSIVDSGPCYVSSDVTIMAGKNESGKTAILRGLAEITNATKIGDLTASALPMNFDGDALTGVELAFSHSKEEIEMFAETAQCELPSALRQTLSKTGTTWFVSADERILQEIDFSGVTSSDDFLVEQSNEAKALVQKVNAAGQQLPETEVAKIGTGEFKAPDFIALLDPPIKQLEATSAPVGQALRAEANAFMKRMKPSASQRFLNTMWRNIPQFVYFDEFSDDVPSSIELSAAPQHEGIRNLAALAKLDLEKLSSIEGLLKRKSLLEKQSAVLTGDFGTFWNQDDVELVFGENGGLLTISIKDKNGKIHYELAQRSRGFQYFLTFYAKLNAQGEGAKVLLIDEPGLFLHAKAQEDALSVLEKLSHRYQVIFSTHSPYMIRADRIDRVRLVAKSEREQQTTIQNKPHVGADAEAFRPITTALGLDVQRAFGNFGRRNLIVEGPTDYYVLTALNMFAETKLLEGTSIVPCVGATQVSTLASFFTGSGLPYVALFDHDKEGKGEAGRLRAKYVGNSDPTLFVSDTDGDCIEDLFHRADFVKIFLQSDADVKSFGDLRNSDIAKKLGVDKVLAGKKFLETVTSGNVKLTETTLKRFAALVSKINERLKADDLL